MKIYFLLKITNLASARAFVVIHGSEDLQHCQPAVSLQDLRWAEQIYVTPELREHIRTQGKQNFTVEAMAAGPTRKSLSSLRDRVIQELRLAGTPVYNKPRKPPVHMSRKPGYIPNQMWTNNPMRYQKCRDKLAAKMRGRVYVRNSKGQIVKHYSKAEWEVLQASKEGTCESQQSLQSS